MLEPSRLPPRARALGASLVQRAWDWIGAVAIIGPDDERGRRFAHMGAGTCIGFPASSIFGEQYIAIGARTLIGTHLSLVAGMFPGEPLDVPGGIAVSIGSRCMIGRGNSIIGRRSIVIEDDVTTAPNVYITDHNHSYHDLRIPIGKQWPVEAPVRIGTGTWLGTGVVVLPGASIGAHVAVAANSVVRGTIPDRCVIAGSPARIVRRYVDGEGWVPPLAHSVDTPEWWSEPYPEP